MLFLCCIFCIPDLETCIDLLWCIVLSMELFVFREAYTNSLKNCRIAFVYNKSKGLVFFEKKVMLVMIANVWFWLPLQRKNSSKACDPL